VVLVVVQPQVILVHRTAILSGDGELHIPYPEERISDQNWPKIPQGY
jgi:hypothetical protein